MLWQILKNALLINRNKTPVNQHSIDQLIQSAIAQYQAGQLQKAEDICHTILEEQPDHTYALHLLGLIAHQVGNNEIAINLIEKAIKINPTSPDFYNTCGEAYRMLYKFDLAISHFEQAIAIKPDFAEAYNNLGNALNGLGRTEDAITSFEKAITIKPDFAEAYNNLGNALNGLGHTEDAIASFEKAITIKPDYIFSYNNLGIILYCLGRTSEAIASFEKGIAIEPDFVAAHNNLGNVLKEIGKQEEAIKHYERAITINPDFSEAYNNLGFALQELGQKEEASSYYKQALNIKPDYAAAYLHLSMTEPIQEYISKINELLTNPSISEEDEMYCHYALGNILHKNKSFSEAFEHYLKANTLKRKTFTYDPEAHSEYIDKLIEAYSKDFFQEKKSFGSDSELPVFIVGMPRSGTSLVEQIISSHPEVHGAGELEIFGRIEKEITKQFEKTKPYPECISLLDISITDQYANMYLNEIRVYSQKATRITDKNPGNFHMIGLIKTLFPNARIIHCQRNALDICTSIFTNFFVNGNEYSFDLEELGQYYLDYEKIMTHWHSLFSDEIFDVQYEELVMNQEKISRQMIDYIGLDWNEECLDFQKNKRAVRTASNLQVRQPIYKNSINRWKQYGKQLEPLIAVLQLQD